MCFFFFVVVVVVVVVVVAVVLLFGFFVLSFFLYFLFSTLLNSGSIDTNNTNPRQAWVDMGSPVCDDVIVMMWL